jgi:CHASE2 domain-containing sensor protein
MFAPIIYLRSRDQLYSARSKPLLALGLARWAITFFMLFSSFFAGVWFPVVPLALGLLHIGVLCYAAFRGRRILHAIVDVPPPSFPGFPELA